jgi:hypothetical protein
MRMLSFVAAVSSALLTSTVTFAQVPAPPAPLQMPECRRGALPATPGETTGSIDLGDQLSRSKGVICPPAGVDPGIAAPPVGGGVTPVIPHPERPVVTRTLFRGNCVRRRSSQRHGSGCE